MKQNYLNDITIYNGAFKAWAFNSKACEVLNRRFKTYPNDVELVEGVFTFDEKELKFVEAVLTRFGGLEPLPGLK